MARYDLGVSCKKIEVHLHSQIEKHVTQPFCLYHFFPSISSLYVCSCKEANKL